MAIFARRLFPARVFAPRLWPGTAVIGGTGALGLADALAAFLADALIDELLGGASVWSDESPAGAEWQVLPRVVVVDLGGSIGFDNDAGGVEESEVQVTGFASTRAEARALGRAIRLACTDPEPAPALDLGVGSAFYVRPTGPPIVTLDPAKGPGGSDVWRADLTVRALVEIA